MQDVRDEVSSFQDEVGQEPISVSDDDEEGKEEAKEEAKEEEPAEESAPPAGNTGAAAPVPTVACRDFGRGK